MLFLIAIVMSFILYGMTSSLFPSVWTTIASDIGVDYSLLGIITMIPNATSGISSAFAYKVRRKLGTNLSVTAGLIGFLISMLFFFSAKNIVMICIAYAVLGTANGIIDTVANSYIVKAYAGGVSSFLHASWGIGSSIGPMLMSLAILNTGIYKNGFLWVAIILVITIAIFGILKVYWQGKKKTVSEEYVKLHSVSEEEKQSHIDILDTFKIHFGTIFVACFVLCGSVNSVFNAWIATFAVEQHGLSATAGATAATCFFVGLTAMRLILTVASRYIESKTILYSGMIISLIGSVFLYIKTDNEMIVYAISVIIGIGIAPVVPFLHHSIKEIFDEKYIGVIVSACNSMALIGSSITVALVSLAIKIIGINNVQIILIIYLVLALILYHQMTKSRTKA